MSKNTILKDAFGHYRRMTNDELKEQAHSDDRKFKFAIIEKLGFTEQEWEVEITRLMHLSPEKFLWACLLRLKIVSRAMCAEGCLMATKVNEQARIEWNEPEDLEMQKALEAAHKELYPHGSLPPGGVIVK